MAHAINLNDYAHHADHTARPGIIARLLDALANYRAYGAIRDELDAMSDSDLADIGLSRHTIRDVARTAVYGV